MSANAWKLAAILAAIATVVFAADMFMAAPGNQSAARAVMIVGVVIFMFTFALAIGGVTAGLLRGFRQWRDRHDRGAHAGAADR